MALEGKRGSKKEKKEMMRKKEKTKGEEKAEPKGEEKGRTDALYCGCGRLKRSRNKDNHKEKK